MNDTTFQGDGKIAYVPVVVNTKLTKPSNADRIRAMSDEELAEWLDQIDGVGMFPGQTQWLDWLRQEVSE